MPHAATRVVCQGLNFFTPPTLAMLRESLAVSGQILLAASRQNPTAADTGRMRCSLFSARSEAFSDMSSDVTDESVPTGTVTA